MKFSEYSLLFNRNVFIKDNVIVDSNGLIGAEHRSSLIDKYTGVIDINGVSIGIKPESHIENDIFILDFRLSVLIPDDEGAGTMYLALISSPDDNQDKAKRLVRRICDDIIQGDMDIETELAKYEFAPYFTAEGN